MLSLGTNMRTVRTLKYILISSLLVLFSQCGVEEKSLFSLMSAESTGIHFSNDLTYTEEFNPYTYRNFCNGGGVALGDVNNDGLLDIYLSGNLVDNKLYINKGNLLFEDVTEAAGVACTGVWSAGVSMVDINGDGLLDIYVCKAGMPGGDRRYNELFINNGDLTFTESAKAYGLDIVGLSIHSAFFDYDMDGDLDCYILNNSMRSVGGFDLKDGLRDIPSDDGNKLLRNDNGVFVDVSTAAGIYTSAIGYGLGITLSDFNRDRWPDLFISNDFFERDYLYINNQDGTFSEEATSLLSSMSMGSMGADAADVNNDLLPDLFVTEMLPATLARQKTKTQFETWDKYQEDIKRGYHHQYGRNVLQVSSGAVYQEVGRMAGVQGTEWSWSSLMQDYDNDGLRDIFISNGIYKDLLDKDYLNYFAHDSNVRAMIKKDSNVVTKLVDNMPSKPVPNHMYRNKGDAEFEYVSDQWGLDLPTFSNGSAYGDLDNDGDLDLVLNNVNLPASLYQNHTDTAVHRYIQVDLVGSGKNTAAIGSKVIVYAQGQTFMAENFTSRGFQSTVPALIHVGLGDILQIDSVKVQWPDGTESTIENLAANQRYTIKRSDVSVYASPIVSGQKVSTQAQQLPYRHKEIGINQFAREPMLVKMTGHRGPAVAMADVDGDGLQEVFVGGAKNQASTLLKQDALGKHTNILSGIEDTYRSEVTDALFYDSDDDGDQDLYVAHGGKLFSAVVPELHDVLYINDGNGTYTRKTDAFTFPYPMSTSCVAMGDLNGDAYPDLVVGEGMKPKLYGLPGSIHILMSTGPATYAVMSPSAMADVGMVTGVAIVDIDGDEQNDIVAVGEWMPVTIFSPLSQDYKEVQKKQLPQSTGLWRTIATADLDRDGDLDLLLGNEGYNSALKADYRMYVGDFDSNGGMEQIIASPTDGLYYPLHDIDEMYKQLPMLRKKYKRYKACAEADMVHMFGTDLLSTVQQYILEEVGSVAIINDGDMTVVPLPPEVQYSTVHAFAVTSHEGEQYVLCGGNDYNVKPQYGRLDASDGWLLQVSSQDGAVKFTLKGALGIKGQIRDIAVHEGTAIFGINNDSLQISTIVYD